MPNVDAVLFDYGRTLVTFAYPTEELLEVLRRFRPRIESAIGTEAPAAEAILKDVLLPLELMYAILDEEQQCWDRAVRVDADALQVLAWLGAHGVKRALCSNAPFPPEMMRRQVDANGVGELMDAVLFSSGHGRRKPAPEIYRAALSALGVSADRAMFVGDRMREDYEGPLSIGMRAVIYTAHASEVPPDGIPTIASLTELPGLL